jgi:prepilin-type N-terminal cleavage/methylation domain-containing protein
MAHRKQTVATVSASPARLAKAFTLVELLVVIAIIGTLVGLLLPAVQSAREAARLSTCQSKIKQQAIACQNYESAKRTFPPGQKHQLSVSKPTEFFSCGDNSAPAGYDVVASDARSWMVEIMPYIEQSAEYAKLDFTKSATAAPNAAVLRTPGSFQFVACPTNPIQRIFSNWGSIAHYGGSAGLNNNNCWITHSGNRMDGMFYGVDANVSPGGCKGKDVSDGLSKTVMICEKLGYYPVSNIPGTPGFTQCRTNAVAPSSSWYWDFKGVNWGSVTRMENGPQRVASGNHWGATSPYSFHIGGLSLAFGDGSTQFISESISITVWNAIANRADGSTLSP